MRKILLVVLLLASCSLVFGQLSSYTITITASRSIALQADQAVFNVAVTSGVATGLDEVVSALQGSGITAANLSGVGTQTVSFNNKPQQMQQWSFTLAVPFSQIATTITSLTKVQQAIVKNNNGITLGFNLQGTQVSPQVQTSQTCPIPALVADARAQAQKVAAAAGFGVGSVLALSNGNVSSPSPVGAAVSAAFISVSQFVSQPSPTIGCSVTVKFGLLPN